MAGQFYAGGRWQDHTVSPTPKVKLIGWSGDERYVQVEVNGAATWKSVEVMADGTDTITVEGVRFAVMSCDVRPYRELEWR